MDDNADLYQNLASAVIYMAAKDYRDESEKLRVLKADEPRTEERHIQWEKKVKKAEKEIRSIESFFLSRWYTCLTTIDGEWMLKKLQQEVKANDS